jgi:hypothetical protein
MADYTSLFQQAGQQYNVNPQLLAAVAQTESGGNPNAVSPAGAVGLMQMMPATAQALGVKDPTDPTQAIPAAARLLSQNLDRYGNVPDALRAYNGGTDPSKWNNPETQAYVGKVANAYGSIGQSSPSGQQTAQNGESDVPLTSPSAQPNDAFSQAFGSVMPKDAPPQASSSPTDAFTQAFGPALAAASSPDATKPGFWSNVGSGIAHSVSSSGPLFGALNNMTAWGDKNIPGAQAVDNAIGGPTAAQNAAITENVAQGQKQFQAGAGKTWGGNIGNIAGTIATTAPLAELAAGGVGALAGSGAGAFEAGSAGNRLLMAARTAATGAGAATIPGRIVASSTTGALRGAVTNATTGASPIQGAESGLALGPVGLGVGSVAAPILRRGAQLLGSLGDDLLNSLGAPGATSKLGTSVGSALAPAAEDTGAASGVAPGAAMPGSATAPGGATSVNPLTGAPIETAQNIPTSLPKTGISLTQKSADATADRIIAHFAQGGPTDITDNALLTASDGTSTKPSLAQVTGNPGIATLERAVQSQSPQGFAQRWQGNDAVRNQVIGGLTGQPGDIDAAEAARDALTSQARTAAFANAKPVDAEPVVDQVQALIAQNAGRPTVQGPLQQVLKQLVQKVPDPTVDPTTGLPTPGATIEQPISDPATLYNVRKYIGDIVSPKVAGTAQDGRAAAAQLLTLKPVLDDVIESGAPGFKNYITQFDQLSRPIDGMRALQALNLTDANGNTTLQKLDTAVKSLTKQQAAPGYRNADGITPEQMQQLVALRDNMRQAGQSNLGRALGSNTFQNLATNNLLNAAGSKGGHVAAAVGSALGADAALGPVAGLVAPTLSYAATHVLGKLGENSREMVMQSLTNKLLNPQAALPALQAAARKAGQ